MGQALERELPETPNATCSRQCQPRADAGWVRDVRDENVAASPVTNSRKGSRVLPGDRLDGIGCPGELAGGVVLTEHGHSGHARDQRARGRREGERREAGQEHPAAAEPIAQRGAGQDQRGEGQADSPWPSLDNGHKALTDRDLNMSANRRSGRQVHFGLGCLNYVQNRHYRCAACPVPPAGGLVPTGASSGVAWLPGVSGASTAPSRTSRTRPSSSAGISSL